MLDIETKSSPEASTPSYHHGDLRAELIRVATTMLEDGETFSLRAAARRAGVTHSAPYRHFADRGALEAAVAREGWRHLVRELALARSRRASEGPESALVEMAAAYVGFAIRRARLFRLFIDTGQTDLQITQMFEAVIREAGLDEGDDIATIDVLALSHGFACLAPLTSDHQTNGEVLIKRVRAAITCLIRGSRPMALPVTNAS